MSKIRIDVNDQEVLSAFRHLVDQGGDLTPAMLAISETMQDSVEQAFIDEADPETGESWQALSPVTLALRKKRGQPLERMLHISGQLLAAVQSDAGPDFALVSNNKEYAAIQHFGGMAGRNRKVEIPARPYFGLWPEHREEIMGIIGEHLLKALPGT